MSFTKNQEEKAKKVRVSEADLNRYRGDYEEINALTCSGYEKRLRFLKKFNAQTYRILREPINSQSDVDEYAVPDKYAFFEDLWNEYRVREGKREYAQKKQLESYEART
jgi:hypothetical protein